MKNSSVIIHPLFQKNSSRDIISVLSEKGFADDNSLKNADFLVAFYATARNKAEISPPTYRIGRFGRRWVRPGHCYNYKQGSLIIDVVDRKKKELVWRGIGSAVLDRSDPKRTLMEAVKKVLADFPPIDR